MRSLPLLLLLAALPAAAAPPPLQRAELMLRSTADEVNGLEAPLEALIGSARDAADAGGQRDPALLLDRDAAVVDRRADALARKAAHLATTIDELVASLPRP